MKDRLQVYKRHHERQQEQHPESTLYFSLDVSRFILHHSKSMVEMLHSTENGTSSKESQMMNENNIAPKKFATAPTQSALR